MPDVDPQSISSIHALANNGGFHLALESVGDTFPGAIAALFNSGSLRAAELLQAALQLAFGDGVPESMSERAALLDSMDDDATDALQRLADEFTDMDDPADALVSDLPPIDLGASDSVLASLYAEMTLEREALGLKAVSRANKMMDQLHQIAVRLRGTASGRGALRSLIGHPSPNVRLSAANECLFWDDADAVTELDLLEAQGGATAFDAHYILIGYRAGTRKRY